MNSSFQNQNQTSVEITEAMPGVAFLASGCGVLFGESLAPLTVVVASSALSQVLGDLAVIFSSPRRFGVFSLWFPRGSGFLNLLLCLLQLTHFCFICFGVMQPQRQHASFSPWDLYTLFVLRVINSGMFSTAFSLVTTLFRDRHEEEGANDLLGVRFNAYSILAQAARDAGTVRDEMHPSSNADAIEVGIELGASASASATKTETDTDTEIEMQTRHRHGDCRLVEWVHGARTSTLPTRREFVLFPIDIFLRASRWITLATWLTLLPAFITHFVPGVVFFALFIPGGLLVCAASAALIYLIVLRRTDVVGARHAARVVQRVVNQVNSYEAGTSLALPRYALLTPALFIYLSVRALVIGALGSVVQILCAAAVHHAVILFTRSVPLPPAEYWGVSQTWWMLLNTRCYAESIAAKTGEQVEATRRSLAFITYFV